MYLPSLQRIVLIRMQVYLLPNNNKEKQEVQEAFYLIIYD